MSASFQNRLDRLRRQRIMLQDEPKTQEDSGETKPESPGTMGIGRGTRLAGTSEKLQQQHGMLMPVSGLEHPETYPESCCLESAHLHVVQMENAETLLKNDQPILAGAKAKNDPVPVHSVSYHMGYHHVSACDDFLKRASRKDSEKLLKQICGHMGCKDAPMEAMSGHWNTLRTYIESLRDTETLQSFVQWLSYEKSAIVGKVVMEVGCGIGILSLLCANLGCQSVIAVDSTPFSLVAAQLAEENNLDQKITIVTEKLDRIKRLPDGTTTVDVIVSDWFGLGFFKRNLLHHVLSARDKWMDVAKIIPSNATLFICAISDDSHHTRYKRWKNAGGVDFSVLGALDMTTPVYGDDVEPRSVCTTSCQLHVYDVETMRVAEVKFTEEFCLRPLTGLLGSDEVPITGLVVYFDSYMVSDKAVSITTDPMEKRTKYGQTTFCLPAPPLMNRNSELNGRFTYIPAIVEGTDPVFIVEYAMDDCEVSSYYYGTSEKLLARKRK